VPTLLFREAGASEAMRAQAEPGREEISSVSSSIADGAQTVRFLGRLLGSTSEYRVP